MKVYQITPGEGLNSCIEKDIEKIKIWFEESDIGDRIIIDVFEMDEDEYLNLPEYMGP